MRFAVHRSVLSQPAIDLLAPAPGETFVDGTLGAAGHAWLVLSRLGEHGRLVGIDRDPMAVARAREAADPRLLPVEGNFADLPAILDDLGIGAVDGVLFDLGISSDQLDDPERGLSFRTDGPLDMRLSPGDPTTAADLVNGLREAELADLLWRYGEERWSRRIARRIVERRPLSRTGELREVVAGAIPRGAWPRGIDPATRTFQALRIEVNDELRNLERGLDGAIDRLVPGGRVAVISFHSLEDGIVKRRFREETRDCICPPESPRCTCGHHRRLRILTRKPVQPDAEEIAANPRSRSARLRAAQRLATPEGAPPGST
ncbi:MAG: 16S rRNA (cytosine(1402)-N(4))-methyltransferase RsmH [Candidatus Dormibacteraeota bacterium]|nr:16S rRNA (cytosine(1402)-N(4))-methyltransferase RsmH [Candidatus Dormibacteraeota bacterium]